jgi:hypothetical protein
MKLLISWKEAFFKTRLVLKKFFEKPAFRLTLRAPAAHGLQDPKPPAEAQQAFLRWKI